MSGDSNSESELGRSKNSATPAEHLVHLLTLGWSPTSPLILKFVAENRLQRELTDWQAVSAETAPGKHK